MERITSPDGTEITFYRSGAGAPLVLVHGTSGSAQRWAPVLPALEARFTVIRLDRRGYGASGDHPAYALEREFEDVAAVVAALGEPAHLLGHSFGALCALEAAARAASVRKLILYEPALPLPGTPVYPDGFIERVQGLLAAEDREGVLAVLFREVAGMSAEAFAALKALPAWPDRVAAAHLVVREAAAESRYAFDEQRFAALETPTLLLSGGDSPPAIKAMTVTVSAALPNSRIAVLPGQQHVAMDTAPDLFLREVLGFLAD